jgi:uncharacterized protein YjbJ (UPF0337 family)
MDKDRIKGAAKKTAGRIEQAAGDITGNDRTKAKGQVKEAEGAVQEGFGKAKDAIRKAAK